jgi:hypothetical protein
VVATGCVAGVLDRPGDAGRDLPCALSLATPTALTAATGTLHKLGLLLTRGHVLEGLNQIDTVIFDKTGTLTEGRLALRASARWAPGQRPCLAWPPPWKTAPNTRSPAPSAVRHGRR